MQSAFNFIFHMWISSCPGTICWRLFFPRASQVLLVVRNPPANSGDVETQVQFLGQEDALEEGMATHSTALAWRTSWTEEPEELQSMGSQRVIQLKRLSIHASFPHWKLSWHPCWNSTDHKCRIYFSTLNSVPLICMSSLSQYHIVPITVALW